MRVIARGTLRAFLENRCSRPLRPGLAAHLNSWFAVVSRADWASSAELKQELGSTSIVSARRVVFNIKGDHFRLVADIDYEHRAVFIKWLGTHSDYDQIDVKKVESSKERYADPSHPN